MAAVVIAALALSPSFDALICGGEGLPAASTPVAGVMVQAGDSADHHYGILGHKDRGGVCPHGHCHHGNAAKQALEAPMFAIVSYAARLPIPLTDVPVSNPRYGLDRPPRA